MEDSKVKVRIYGQENTISGERDADAIREIADHVNEKMRELSRSCSTNGQGNLAVLTAINIADEYYEAKAETERLKEANERLRRDTEHYLRMWEDAKKNFSQYQESAAKAQEEKKVSEERYKELEARCSEFENSFFDLQMENLQLKSQLEKVKKTDEF